jgi:hypothetical protein
MKNPKYKELAEQMRRGRISDNVLIEAYHQKMNERPILFAELGNNEGFFWRGDVKGTPSYNEWLAHKLIDDAAILLKGRTGLYFLTITYSIYGLGIDLYEAWRRFRKHCNKLCRALKRRYNANYVMVLESTLRGYPHAHIILSMPEFIDPEHGQMKPGEKVEGGTLHHFIKERVESPQFCLQVAEDRRIEHYLCKYISKTTKDYKLHIEDDRTKLEEHERKELLTLLMPFMASVRQVARSEYKKTTPPKEEITLTENEREILQSALTVGIWTAEATKTLVLNLYKMTLNCRSKAWFFSRKFLNGPPPEGNIYFSDLREINLAEFAPKLIPLGCHGCQLTQFIYQKSELLDDDYLVNNFARKVA